MKNIVKLILVILSAIILNGCAGGGFVITNSGFYPYGGVYYTAPVYPYTPPGYYHYYSNPHFEDRAHSGYHHHR